MQTKKLTLFRFREYPPCLEAAVERLRASSPLLVTYEQMGEALGIETRTKTKKCLKAQMPMKLEVFNRLIELACLSRYEADYLHLLRKIHYSKDVQQMFILSKKLLDLRREHFPDQLINLEEKQLAIFEQWYLFPLIFYFRFDQGRKASLEDLARAFKGQLSREAIALGLARLMNVSLLEEISPETYRRTSEGLALLDHAPRVVIRNYHRLMITKAIESVELPTNQRFLSGATLAVKKENVDKIQERIADFLKEMVTLYGDSSAGDEVYQLQTQFFSLIEINSRAKDLA